MQKRMIKFRAWDKTEKKMFRVTLMDFPEWHVSVQDGENYYRSGDRNSFKNDDTDRCVLMQFTGIYDKNKKEIFEGDILVRRNHRRYKEIAVVEYSSASFWPLRKGNNSKWEYLDSPMDFYEKCEVIGNIYENPELIKGE